MRVSMLPIRPRCICFGIQGVCINEVSQREAFSMWHKNKSKPISAPLEDASKHPTAAGISTTSPNQAYPCPLLALRGPPWRL